MLTCEQKWNSLCKQKWTGLARSKAAGSIPEAEFQAKMRLCKQKWTRPGFSARLRLVTSEFRGPLAPVFKGVVFHDPKPVAPYHKPHLLPHRRCDFVFPAIEPDDVPADNRAFDMARLEQVEDRRGRGWAVFNKPPLPTLCKSLGRRQLRSRDRMVLIPECDVTSDNLVCLRKAGDPLRRHRRRDDGRHPVLERPHGPLYLALGLRRRGYQVVHRTLS